MQRRDLENARRDLENARRDTKIQRRQRRDLTFTAARRF